MNGKVHGSAGICLSGYLLVQYPPDSFVVATASIVGGAFFALLCDIDHRRSSLSLQPGMNILSKFISVLFKHRGFTHSLFAVALIFFYLRYSHFKPIIIWTWVGTFLSHIILDMFNEEGVQLFWPLPYRIALLPNLLSVSSQPYSIIQNILFIVFQTLGTIFCLHALFTLCLQVGELKFLGDIWYHFIVPYLTLILGGI
ncbi:hypothetical protein EJP82_26050 [Paenibacillus anaericanus]|uniref:Metal-dependent hydrolase n=1 Tax=Paenibacillus anaericanus TaxID=170367 RepID=A0A433XXB8_9BACL|nr:metal-dependent hydrolase [Paenibacillus anaericanus]RUT39496.1 hypothetical protein EJP82_26050 [Paenibacillus anaericanus]